MLWPQGQRSHRKSEEGAEAEGQEAARNSKAPPRLEL